ncbi:LytR/AlgR family response regulator transcription factor [Emticicia sp. SJ17W-69]|uniref:LytR/AlgR family response regulator transcription factor n=1 Tax=Emticicia sp. SJ17W-69 TaxID=3421657 RepID=UPI003EB96579
MITALIIDDEPSSLEALKLKIQKVTSDIEIIGTFYSAKEALNFMEDLAPDLIFLDVEMPEMDGFSFLEQFSTRSFEVIITTAHDEYAIKAVRQSVIDFLLKPVNISELKDAIERLKQKLKAKQKNEKSSYQKLNAQFDKIPIPSMRGLLFVPVKEILYLISEGNYTTILMENSQKIVSSRNLGDYESLLENLHFFRIHHSTIINLSQIKEYLKGEGGSVILSDGTELDVSKRKKKEFLELIGF